MRCIIPAAGKGTRLRPHTHTKPKALLSLSNRPIISHILDSIIEAGITEIIIIVGYEKEKLIEYLKQNHGQSCNLIFIEQKERKGLGHAIYTALEYLDGEPVLIALGDSLYENSFSQILQEFNKYPEWDGAITIREVNNPQSYGIVVTEENSAVIKELEEKPKNPRSSKAITGIYMIRNSLNLNHALSELIKQNQLGAGGEIQLTDALQLIINEGSILGTIDSGKWFDCGKKAALLSANEYVLSKKDQPVIKSKLDNSIIIPPVAVAEDCVIINSVIGPYVSIDKGTHIVRSIISSSIIGAHTVIKNTSIHDSLIGDEVELKSGLTDLDIGDHSKIQT